MAAVRQLPVPSAAEPQDDHDLDLALAQIADLVPNWDALLELLELFADERVASQLAVFVSDALSTRSKKLPRGHLQTRVNARINAVSREIRQRQHVESSPEQQQQAREEAIRSVSSKVGQLATMQASIQMAVNQARDLGATWADIGDAAGVSLQAAQQRWSEAGREANRERQRKRREAQRS